MGINRWSDIEERKRNETNAKAGDEVPKGKKGDASSRLQASKEPAQNETERRPPITCSPPNSTMMSVPKLASKKTKGKLPANTRTVSRFLSRSSSFTER